MLLEHRCFTRKCANLRRAVERLDEDVEASEVPVCLAFPVTVGGIPDEIAYGDNLHLTVLEGQKNLTVFRKRTKNEIPIV
jgi:hypothetical protein